MFTAFRKVLPGLIALFFLSLSLQGQTSYPPGLMFSTMLNGVKVDYKSGVFKMEKLQAVFLPEAQSKTIYKYNPDDGGKVQAVIRSKDGEIVDIATFYGEKLKQVFWLLSSYKLGQAEMHNFKLPGAGAYTIDFYLESELFYRFPFKLVAKGSDDPYDPDVTWHLEGDWSDYGYLYYANADPQRTLAFKFWLTEAGKMRSANYVELDAVIVNASNGKIVCQSPAVSMTPKPWWIRYETGFQAPKGGIYPTKELLKRDGKYIVKVNVDGKLHGSYPFRVKNGKIEYQGRTERKGTDPMIFIEGGRDAWWLRRSEAAKEDCDWLVKTAQKSLEK